MNGRGAKVYCVSLINQLLFIFQGAGNETIRAWICAYINNSIIRFDRPVPETIKPIAPKETTGLDYTFIRASSGGL